MDLNRLSGLKAPKPSESKKAEGLASAMAAFDAEEKKSRRTQGSVSGGRQSSIVNQIWSSVMNRKFLAGSALATLLVVPAAGYITLQIARDQMYDRKNEVLITQLNELNKKKSESGIVDQKVGDENSPRTASNKKSDMPVGLTETEKPAPESKAADTEVRIAEPTATVQGGRQNETSVVADSGVKDIETATSEVARKERRGVDESAGLDRLRTQEAMPIPEAMPKNPAESGVATGMIAAEAPQDILSHGAEPSGDTFSSKDINPVKSVAVEPVSTFSIDVDTASYAYMRQALTNGHLPEADSVRVEEMINYFPYAWTPPESADQAFRANISVMPTPWNEHTRLMHIGIKGYEVVQASQPAANLVFLIDVSGSMNEPNKLPLLKSAFRLLVGRLKATDTVSIVVYAGHSGVVLEPTKASEREKILEAIDNLSPGGSTAGAEGLDAAYRLAKKAFVKDGVNRILLATDGDFNVGPSSVEELKSIIEEKRKTGIFLSVLGFGTGNYNDALMQTIAQNGNGTAAYIDTLSEAQKTLVEEAGASLFPIAKDVKIQVEFNPAKIAEYRLIGYETRALNREDFNNDRVDAGGIGSGHRVTAIYEVTPKGSPAMMNDDLRYGAKDKPAAEAMPDTTAASDELAFVKIRFKKPDADKSQLVTIPVTEANAVANLDAAAEDVRFSVAVAAFGQKLKNTVQLSDFGYDAIIDMASRSRGTDEFGYRAEFVTLVRLAQGLKAE